MPAIRTFSQAANFVKNSNNLSDALKQPPLTKPTEKWETDQVSTPKKSSRGRGEMIVGAISMATSVLPLISGIGNLIKPALSKSSPDSSASPITEAQQVRDILSILYDHSFLCRHTYDMHFECRRKYRHRLPRDTNQIHSPMVSFIIL